MISTRDPAVDRKVVPNAPEYQSACHCILFHNTFKYKDLRSSLRLKGRSVGTPSRNKATIVFSCILWFLREASAAVRASGLWGKLLSDVPGAIAIFDRLLYHA